MINKTQLAICICNILDYPHTIFTSKIYKTEVCCPLLTLKSKDYISYHTQYNCTIQKNYITNLQKNKTG